MQMFPHERCNKYVFVESSRGNGHDFECPLSMPDKKVAGLVRVGWGERAMNKKKEETEKAPNFYLLWLVRDGAL